MENEAIIGAVVVAAGSSSRLGMPKQLVEIDGKVLLVRVIEAIRGGINGPVAVVLGADEDIIRDKLIGMDIEVVQNPDWQRGMGTSIAAGVRHLIGSARQLSSILISVCDQPKLETVHIRELVMRIEQHPDSIVASHYAGTHGPPAIFPFSRFEELANLSGSRGAKYLFIKHVSKLLSCPFPEGEFDLDTAQDLQNLNNPYPKDASHGYRTED